MSGIALIKFLHNRSKAKKLYGGKNNNESLVKLLNLYEWIVGFKNMDKIVAAAHTHENPIICIEVQQHSETEVQETHHHSFFQPTFAPYSATRYTLPK